jgi:16S rRNA (cytosine967-C5)-methyltransferase
MAGERASARGVALDLISSVLERGQFLDASLDRHKPWKALAARDRAFARLLVATLLRRLGQIDALLDHCLQRPLKPRQTDLKNLLRLGAVQLLFLDTPPHAAVSTALALAETSPRLAGQKGLVNAVLRRLAREGKDLIAEQDAARLNTPDWLWASWAAAYGEATAGAIAAASLEEAPLDLSAKEKATVWARRLDAKVLFEHSIRLSEAGGDVTRLAGYNDGAWWVQDAAAALTAGLLQAAPGARVLDLCAAPGGKTAFLAARGFRVTAVDRSAFRLKRLEANLSRLKLTAEVRVADALQWRPAEKADAILLDAPCSATGTLRRHPDIKHLRRPDDLEAVLQLQQGLIDAALEMLRPGGQLLYVVCSLQPEEGTDQMRALFARRTDVKRQAVAPEEVFHQGDFLTPEGDFRSLPCHIPEAGGLDGFFACRLVKV